MKVIEMIMFINEIQQNELADKIGIASQNLNGYVKGRLKVPQHVKNALGEILNIDGELLFKNVTAKQKGKLIDITLRRELVKCDLVQDSMQFHLDEHYICTKGVHKGRVAHKQARTRYIVWDDTRKKMSPAELIELKAAFKKLDSKAEHDDDSIQIESQII